jgi:hypothetical protein
MRVIKAWILILILTAPVVAFAAEPKTLKELAALIVTILNRATVVLVAAGLVIFLYGTAFNLFKSGEQGGNQLRQFLVWGVIALFVMVSIWGILRLLQATLLGGTGPTEGGARPPVRELQRFE